MKDKNNTDVKKGDLVKRCGFVTYADGPKYKISKNTWLVSKVEDGKVFYTSRFIGSGGQEFEEDVELKLPEGVELLVVGNKKKGLDKEFHPVSKIVQIAEGSVEQNYRVHKDVAEKNWKKGDIVKIHGRVAQETLDSGVLEVVPNSLEHKHVLIVVDPVRMGLIANNS